LAAVQKAIHAWREDMCLSCREEGTCFAVARPQQALGLGPDPASPSGGCGEGHQLGRLTPVARPPRKVGLAGDAWQDGEGWVGCLLHLDKGGSPPC
jgi:hypothetical protein